MTGIEWQTAAAAAGLSALVNFLFYLTVRRSLELRDREYDKLDDRVTNLSDNRLADIEEAVKSEGNKRKTIYERIENIELTYMPKKDCEKVHRIVNDQNTSFIGSVLKLERVATEVDRLIKWLDDVSKEQISHGKDMSALAARLEKMEESRG